MLYKHERCKQPLPPNWRKPDKGKGKGRGKIRGRQQGSSDSERSRTPTLDPRSAEAKAKVPCRHRKKGTRRNGDNKCP